MKINYILSDTTKNATTLALKEVTSISEQDFFQNNIVIVPETKSIIIEKELLKLSKNGAFGNVFVYSFVRLLDRLGKVPKEKIVSKQALVILIRKIIFENIDKLNCYKKTAKCVGFAEKIYNTIAQLKSSGVSPEDLRLTLETKSLALKSKLEDILFLYEKYEENLKGEMYDDCDKLALISEFSKTNEFLKNSNIFVVGFDNITFEMQEVLKSVAKNCKMITFSCVYFDNKRQNKHIQPNELYNKFKHISDSLNYPYVPKRQDIRLAHDLEIIKQNLFSTKKVTANSKGQFSIFKAPSEKLELDFVANTILLGVKNGKRFKDFGVFACDIIEREEQIEACFNAYNIPYFVNVAQKIDNHFLVKFISNAFDLIQTHLKSESVLTFVSNPLFGAKNYEYFESYVNEIGVNYAEFLEDINENFVKNELKGFYNTVKSEDDEDELFDEETETKKQKSIDDELLQKRKENLKMLGSDLKKLKEFYVQFEEILKSSKTASDYIKAIEFILKKFKIKEKLLKIGEYQKQNGLEIQGEITNVIISKLELFNKQVENFLGENIMTTNEFVQIYKSGFVSCKINLSPVSIDCVVVQDNTDGFLDIKDLFIIGAVEGSFPSKLQDSGIILDSELEEAKAQMNKTIEPAVKDINRREKFRVYEALLEPKEKLYLSYYEKKSDGKVARPCQIVNDLTSIFGEDIVKTQYEKMSFVNFDIYENEFANLANKFLNTSKLDKDSAAISQKLNYARSVLGEKLSKPLENYLNVISFGKMDFKMDNVQDIYFSNDKTSISQLQTYFVCPYKFFAQYGLRLSENKLAKISVTDIGTIIHRVVELFTKDIEKYEKLNAEDLKSEIFNLVQIAMDENYFTAEKNKSLVELLYKECENLCKYVLYEQSVSSFKFNKAEYCFDKENAIKLNNKSDRKIQIAGKIDRIDKFNDYVRVIDYKTGEIERDLKSVYYGKKIQLAIYIEAILQSKKDKVAGIFYFPIHSEYKKEEENAKSYQMKGFLLDDFDVLKYMDANLNEDNKASNIVELNVSVDKKTGEIKINHFRRKCYFAKEDFDAIENYVNKLCSLAVDEILDGNVEPSPYSSNNKGNKPTSCEYCELSGFCNLKNAKYKLGRICDKTIDKPNFYIEQENQTNE